MIGYRNQQKKDFYSLGRKNPTTFGYTSTNAKFNERKHLKEEIKTEVTKKPGYLYAHQSSDFDVSTHTAKTMPKDDRKL